MLFKYKAIDNQGIEKTGNIDAVNVDVAINSLQKRGLVIVSVDPAEETSIFSKNFNLFERVTNKDIVIVSRQIATLFEAQVSALRIFRLLSSETDNHLLGKKMNEVADDLQGGSSISKALAKHPDIFSDFYVNMVASGEESGKLDQAFNYLADYLDRAYTISSKAKNALIYPAFIVFTFFAVMILMLTMVIPKISSILKDSGQEVPIYTKVVMGMSDFLLNYGVIFAVVLVIAVFFLVRFVRTPAGKVSFDRFKLSIPYVSNLYEKLYLSRISDNMNTMLSSGISMVRTLEITTSVVGNAVYGNILTKVTEDVKGGNSVSDSLDRHPEIPGIMVQMVKIGEETGNLGSILSTLSKFYGREVINAVDTLVDLIEPIMIVSLAVGVGILLASVLVPIYNISSAF
ncbi:type II secretion system F family protein [Candidatus Nomurabacteria bacterium]|nr:type II secretion system F family protein [Candidatus Nomurabacteria bacterium]